MDIESPIATNLADISTDHRRPAPAAPSTYRTDLASYASAHYLAHYPAGSARCPHVLLKPHIARRSLSR
jgi:hypothetical protein